MSTNKRRLNISLTKEVDKAVSFLADRDSVPQATKVSELLKRALEIEEDQVWDSIANSRDIKNAKFIDHKQAWV